MTNLKKVLALSLAATSILSTASLASFTDQKEITATDAVDTLVAIGVIQGYEDGSFKPERTVTRGEMAKMIYTIKNGGSDDASAFTSVSTAFTDVNGHWAEGYIKYCQSQGIVAGKSTTIFAPDDEVTGVEALKMALVSLGYRADISELTGINWQTNTLAISTENGLTDSYIGSFGTASQRQSAAQVLYNALYADTVKYSAIFESYESQNKTLGESAMNLSTISNVYVKDSDVDAGLIFTTDADLTTLHEDSALKSDRDLTNYIGQRVEILADTKNNKAYGVKPYSSNTVINADKGDLTISGSTITFDGDSITLADTTDIDNALNNANVYIVDNGTNIFTTVTDVTVGEVTFANADKINVSATGFTAGQITTADDNVPSDISVGDFVEIVKDEFNNQYSVTVLTAQTGTVTAIRSNEFRIDGVWYTIASGETNPTLNTDVDFYAVGSVAYDVEVSVEANGDVLYVVDTGVSNELFNSSNVAKVIFADGTEEIITTQNDETDAIGSVVSYTIIKGEYVFSAVADLDTATSAGTIFDTSKKTLGGNYIADDAVVFVAYDDDTIAVISGSDVKNWSNVNTAVTDENLVSYTKTSNGIAYVKVAFVDLGSSKLPNTTTDDVYGLVTADPYNVKIDDVTYTVLSVFNGEETITVNAESAIDIAKGDYVVFEVNSDDITDEVTVITGLSADKVTGYDKTNGIIKLDSAGTLDITDDSVIIYVDSAKNTGVVGGSIILAGDMTGDESIEDNVRVLVQDGEVVVMFVDVNNNMK